MQNTELQKMINWLAKEKIDAEITSEKIVITIGAERIVLSYGNGSLFYATRKNNHWSDTLCDGTPSHNKAVRVLNQIKKG